MVPVALSILLVVLMSGAVLGVVAGDQSKPRSAIPRAVSRETVPGPPAPRRPATSRRLPSPVASPAPVVQVQARPAAPPATVTMAGAPIPRHRARSGVLLVLLVVVVGVTVAAVIGAVLMLLAFAVRSAVTS